MNNNKNSGNEAILEMFIFETNEILEKLVEIILDSEKDNSMSEENINEAFRIMHTIKGSSAMLDFNSVSEISHIVEDVLFVIREEKPQNIDYLEICDVLLLASDFIKEQVIRIEAGQTPYDAKESLIQTIKNIIPKLTQNAMINKYKIKVFFDNDCKMENIRAFTLVNKLKEVSDIINHYPEDVLDDESSCDVIKERGFELDLKSKLSYDEIKEVINKEVFIKSIEFCNNEEKHEKKETNINTKSSVLNIHISKVNTLMDLVGEIVIAETILTKNNGIQGADPGDLEKSAKQFKILINDLKDIVMSLRMIPIATAFNKMHRIVRDMCKKMDKDVELILIGEETEIDKSIVDALGDPLMHIIRNCMDHGIESKGERLKKGKKEKGEIILEARNTGGEVVIEISDNGRGLDKDLIIEKSISKNIISPEDDLSDKEIYNLILLPGFSTKKQVTEFSGRGVGMDVVRKNLESFGGNVTVDSEMEKGTKITIKIPLTLAIIDGMEISVGGMSFIILTTLIKKMFKVDPNQIIFGTDGEEMIMINDKCLPIIRLSKFFNIKGCSDLEDGVMILIENEDKSLCIFADKLMGEKQAVVKPLPHYISSSLSKSGVSGCTIMGDGNISLILDLTRLIYKEL